MLEIYISVCHNPHVINICNAYDNGKRVSEWAEAHSGMCSPLLRRVERSLSLCVCAARAAGTGTGARALKRELSVGELA